jgi:hypothetical protein
MLPTGLPRIRLISASAYGDSAPGPSSSGRRSAPPRIRAGAVEQRPAIRPARLRGLLGRRVPLEYAVPHDNLVAAVLDRVRALFFALRRMTQPLPGSSPAAARLSADLRVRKLRTSPAVRQLRDLCPAPHGRIWTASIPRRS